MQVSGGIVVAGIIFCTGYDNMGNKNIWKEVGIL